MSKMARSRAFVMISLGALMALTLFNAAQLHSFESIVIDNQKQLTELQKGVRVVGGSMGGGGSTASLSEGLNSWTPSAQEAEALRIHNLVVPRPNDFANAPHIEYGGTLKRIIGSDPQGLNPYIANGADNAEYNTYFNDTLATANLSGQDPVFPDARHQDHHPRQGPDLPGGAAKGRAVAPSRGRLERRAPRLAQN